MAPWWAECSKEAYNTGLDGLARALKNWSDSRTGHRARPVAFPRFKSRRRTTPAVRFTTGVIRVEADRKHVTLPRLGLLKVHESTRKLSRRIEAGSARIMSATVRREGGRWFVSFCVEIERADRVPTNPHTAVGVDLGVRALAVLSTGETVPNPRHYTAAQRKLGRAQRTLARRQGPYDPATRSRRAASARYCRSRAKVSRIHSRVANLRRDGLHKLTTRLAGSYGVIVIEDLHVAGMVGNRRLARSISDAGFAEIHRQLSYKTTWHGGQLFVADRWYPSSKTCSGCGAVKTKLALSERTYRCGCGLTLDRDLNAARNLTSLAREAVDARSGRESLNGRGADRKTPLAGQVAVKRQPCTAQAGQTGTVPSQGGTSDHALTREH